MRFFYQSSHCFLLAGSADCSITVWAVESQSKILHLTSFSIHDGPVNAISVCPGEDLIVSCAATGTVAMWKLVPGDGSFKPLVLQTINSGELKMIPLTLAHSPIPGTKDIIMALAGTDSAIRIFVSADPSESVQFRQVACLPGHAGWIFALDFTLIADGESSPHLMLASASQDKYIRLWKVYTADHSDSGLSDHKLRRHLSNKLYQFHTSCDTGFSISFEALLEGHEDWVRTARWGTLPEGPCVLSASADNSLALWMRDPITGAWDCTSRLGEITLLKGSTTATGSAGGFWTGIWISRSGSVGAMGTSGNWRAWERNSSSKQYEQIHTVGGHTKDVTDLCWSADGTYLLSTSHDQTTRLWAEWNRDSKRSWHEFARPQIHGHDINCISHVGKNQFISGAEEKVLRVFDEPASTTIVLRDLSGKEVALQGLGQLSAQVPVLGLSNKAATDSLLQTDTPGDVEAPFPSNSPRPPLEEFLSRRSLWPESEKLYGHGYEISCLATSHDSTLIATACRSTSKAHAVLRLYDTSTWLEIRPALEAHSHTVLDLAFSPDDLYLLSAGRDRSFVIWKQIQANNLQKEPFQLLFQHERAHTRMILSVAWFPITPLGHIFATAGRDCKIHIWKLLSDGAELLTTFSASTSITALAALPEPLLISDDKSVFVLAYGHETGDIGILYLTCQRNGPSQPESTNEGMEYTIKAVPYSETCARDKPSKSISQLSWRPISIQSAQSPSVRQLAVASLDQSVRIYDVSL